RTPVFQVSFALQNAPWVAQDLKGLNIELVAREDLRVRFDMEVHVWEWGGRIGISWLYNRDLFDGWRMEQMGRHYVRVLEAIVGDADQAIREVDLLGPEERQRILIEWNNTGREYPHDKCIHELFEEQVERTPDAVAVVYEDQQVSYGELNERANGLAHVLIEKGIGPEDVVGICLERSVEMIISLLGILKAGAAYLPLDRDYPTERLKFMIEDAQPSCVVTTSE